MKYRFENFNVELVNPTIEELTASYSLDGLTVQISATLNANDNKLFNVSLGNMENTEDWNDAEVMAFATAQLETFKI